MESMGECQKEVSSLCIAKTSTLDSGTEGLPVQGNRFRYLNPSATSTNTFLHGEDIVLERCRVPKCCNSRVHCPFCDVQHFKPSLPARVRDHLNKSHFQHAVYFQDLMIVKCFKRCSHSAGHYHCPLCAAELLKRVAFSRHLASHAKKLGYAPGAVKAPDHKQPDNFLCGGVELSVCKLACPPWEDKHYHCPHCARKSFQDFSLLISHVWRCQGARGKQTTVLSTGETLRDLLDPRLVQSTQPAVDVVGFKCHKSVVRNLSDVSVRRCEVSECCGHKYHCPLCPAERARWCGLRGVQGHLLSHLHAGVKYNEYFILVCASPCEGVSSASTFHFHCPLCEHIWSQRETFVAHLKVCSPQSMPHRSREIKIVGAEMKKKSAKGAESFEVITQEDETVCLSDDLSTVHSQLEDRLASTDAHFPADRGEGEKCEIEKAEDTEKVTEKSQSHLDIGVTVTSGVTETLESHNPCVQASSTKALCTSSLELRDSLGKCSTGSSDEAESSEVKRDSTGGTAGADVERSADVAGSPRTSPSGVCTGEGHKRGEEEEVDEILTEQGLDSSDSSLKRYATRGVKLDFSAVNSGKLTLTRGKSKSSQNWKGKTAHGESVVRGARRQTSKTLSRRKKVLLTSSCASALCDAFDPMVKKSSDSASVYSSTSTKLTQMQPKFSTTSNDQVQISSKRSRKSIHTIGNKKVTISEGAQQSLNNLCENSSVDGNVVSKSMPYFPKVVTLDKSLRPGKRGKVLSHQTNILARSELTDSAVWEKDGEKGTLVESAQVCTCGSLVCSTLASAERAKSLQIGTDCEKTGLLPTTKMSDLYDVATTKNSKLCQVPFASPHFPKDRLVQSNESGERQCAMTDVQKDADVEDNQDNRTLPQTTEDSVACPQCRRAFLVQAQLDYHLSSCHMTPDQTPGLTCRLCGLVAQSHFEMVAHRAGHGPQEFSCRFCHKQFRSEAYLNIHISALHTKSQACTCWQCGKRFNHPRYLRSHAKRHTGEKHHVCKICGFRFFEAHALRRHEETHKHKTQRQYAYICSKCHAGYNNKTNFVDHMNKHTGEKPYACPQCDKRFAYRSMLSRHKVYAHSSARPFSCEFCAKSFRFNSSLAEHRVLHTGVSRNVCGSCQKAFGAKSSLRQHQKRCRFRELLISSQTNLGSDSTMSECGASLQSINHVYVENSLTACTLQRELMFGSAKENPCPSQLNEVIVPRDSGELLLQQREASAPQHSQVILPQQNEVILPQQREVILSQQNEVILPQQREVILPQQRVILPQQSGSVTEQTEVLIPQQNEVILPQQNRAILPQLNEVLVESNFEEATVSSKVVLPLQPSGTDRNVVEGLSSNLTPPTLAGATDGLFFTDSASSKLSSTDVVIDFVQQQNAGPASMADNAAVSGQELPQSDIVESDYFICSGCDSVFDSLAVAQAHLLLGKCSSPDTAAPTGGVPHKPQSQSGSTEVSATSESLLFEAGAAEESSTLSAARETEALCPQSVLDNADCQRLQEVTVLDNAEHQSQSSQEVGAGVASLVLPSCVQIRTSDPSVLQEIVYTTTTPTEVDRLENSGLASDEQVKMSRAEILSSRSPSTGSGQVFQVSSDGAEQIQEVYVLPGESQEGIMELVKKFAQQEGVGTMQIVIQDLPHG